MVNPRLPPLGFLVAIHIVLPLAAFGVSISQPRDWAARNVFRVVVFSEVGALCAWAGLSDRTWQKRTAATLAGLAVCWLLLGSRETRQTPWMLAENLLYPSAITLALATAIKLSPAYLADADGEPTAPAWQFTVGQLFIVTSAVAVVIAFLQNFWQSSLIVNTHIMIAIGAQVGIIVGIWSALPPRWRKLRVAGGAIVACIAGIIVQSFTSAGWFWDALRALPGTPLRDLWEDVFSIPIVMVCETLLAAATTLAARTAASLRNRSLAANQT